ncbi:MAG: histidine kinase [Firmicutes bacterium]|nr:histidine kinase [Bacillota bacterium]
MVTIILCVISLCYLVIKSNHSLFRTAFIIVQSVTILWLLFLLLEWVSFTSFQLLTNIRISLICLNFIAPLWLVAILFLTNRLSTADLWRIPVILAIPFTLSIILLFPESSGVFELYIKVLHFNEQARSYQILWGSMELLTGIYSLFCVFLSYLFLSRHLRNNNLIKLVEKIAVLLIVWSPLAAHYLGVLLSSPFDFKPFTFSLWGVIIVYLSFQRQFFNVVPALVWNVFDVTKEGMAVLGIDGSVNMNKAFLAMFGFRGNDFLDFADELCGGFSDNIRQKQELIGIEVEKNNHYYEISLKNVFDKKTKIMGQLITISDVSETKQFTLEKERARIASDLHDSMGNHLIASLNNLDFALIQPTLERIKPQINTAKTAVVASLMMLRKIVEGLSPIDFQDAEFIPRIKSVINRFSASGVVTDLQISGDLEKLPICVKEFVYNACQEALTNSIIHGLADNIIIKLEYSGYLLSVTIVDNGRGAEKICKNNGLTNMENRVKMLDGKIIYKSPSFGGFGIYAKIPIKGEQK